MRLLAAPGKIQHRRNHDEAGDADALLALQFGCDEWCAEAAIALADDELQRALASVFLDPLANEHRERGRVAVDRPELLAHRLAGYDEMAVAGADRIDEHEIGEVEPSVGVRHKIRLGGRGDVVER